MKCAALRSHDVDTFTGTGGVCYTDLNERNPSEQEDHDCKQQIFLRLLSGHFSLELHK